jgi:N-acetylglucosamine malate deacetylase 1
MKKKILIIAPHADDEILGCGATIHKYSKNFNIYVLILCDAHVGIPEKYSKKFSENIKSAAIKAHKIIGVKKTFFLNYPVLGLQNINNYRLADDIRKFLNKINPEQIFINSRHDLHLDHHYTYLACIVALRNPKIFNIKKILSYETPSESDWGSEVQEPLRLNYFVKIDKLSLQKKIAALKKFKTEYKAKPHPRSEENLIALARVRGSYIFEEFAEAFTVIKILE